MDPRITPSSRLASLSKRTPLHTQVLRTSNKKFYKKFDVPDLVRCGIPVDPEGFTLAHANSTLIITYPKPAAYLKIEAELKKQRDALKAASDGDVDCAQQ